MARMLKKIAPVALWGALGAALAYFFDPESGRRRRNVTKDQATAKVRRTTEAVQDKASYVGGKVEGVTHTVRSPGGEPPPDDKTLADKIKSELLGGDRYPGHQVLVDAADGVVALRGEVQHPEDINELESEVRKVPGVRDVENLLHLPGTPPPNKQSSLGAS